MENQVNKKIFWKLNKTREELEAFMLGDKIDSPLTEVMIGGNPTKWFMRFCPRGSNETNKDHVGFYLYLAEAASKKFQIKFTLGVVGKKGNKQGSTEQPGKSFNAGCGFSKLLQQDELFNLERGYFTDERLTLYCKLTLSNDITNPDKQALSKQTVLSDLKRMLADELFTDFEVRTADAKVLKAHKGVLAARSPLFYELLTSNMKGDVVEVPEDSVIVKAVLSFIYTGEVENLNTLACSLACALFAVAKKYQLNKLVELCIENIIKKVSCENAVETLLAAEGLTEIEMGKLKKELKKECIDMIASNFEFLRTTAEWEKMSPSLLSEVNLHIVSVINNIINL